MDGWNGVGFKGGREIGNWHWLYGFPLGFCYNYISPTLAIYSLNNINIIIMNFLD